jgi:Tfp pilus assembly protein PilZ
VERNTVAASTKDISEGGVFFFTDARFELNNEIDLVFTLPQQVGLPLSGLVCCHGRVVRVDSPDGRQYGIGVKIDRLMPVQQV